mmetsp:Transcript_53712/g.150040  ORF Transcript_53712/g.150040 Transcript_53712/m.150040 type:complete len:338 (-) Transcript_53712:1913-2926(-)
MVVEHRPTAVVPLAVRTCAVLEAQQGRDLAVREAAAFGLQEQLRACSEAGEVGGLQRVLDSVDVQQLRKEPAVDPRQGVDLLHAHAEFEGLRNRPHARRRRPHQLRLDEVRGALLAAVCELQVEALGVEALAGLVDHAQSLLDGLLERAPDGHHFSHALHAAADLRVHRREFAQVPAGNLRDDVVEARLEAGSGAPCDAVAQIHQVAAQGQLRSDVRKRVPGRLRRQRAAPRQARVDLDDAELLAVRVHCVLDVAFPHHAQMAHHLQGTLPQPEVLRIRERLRGGDDDRVSRVDAHRVEILHVAHRDAVVVRVPHHLVLELLPALQTLVHDHLRAVH